MYKSLYFYIATFVIIVIVLSLLSLNSSLFTAQKANPEKTIQVLTYSTFLKSWGPGKAIAEEFYERTGIKVKWIEVNNAGMILENLSRRQESELPDVVVGIDLLSLGDFKKVLSWRELRGQKAEFVKDLPQEIYSKEFAPYNWSPMTFIFKRSELPLPRVIDDLLKEDYANSLALQDPRTSSTGLYFLIWMLALKGEDEGFNFLRKLKPSVRIVAPSWSAAYSLFQNNQVPMVFSFFTSTIYHYVNESDYRYQPVYFDDPHIYSVEFAGVPEKCKNCSGAKQFVEFINSKFAQKHIMEKNYMLPVIKGVKDKTPFDFPKTINLIAPNRYRELIDKKDEILQNWESLNL